MSECLYFSFGSNYSSCDRLLFYYSSFSSPSVYHLKTNWVINRRNFFGCSTQAEKKRAIFSLCVSQTLRTQEHRINFVGTLEYTNFHGLNWLRHNKRSKLSSFFFHVTSQLLIKKKTNTKKITFNWLSFFFYFRFVSVCRRWGWLFWSKLIFWQFLQNRNRSE